MYLKQVNLQDLRVKLLWKLNQSQFSDIFLLLNVIFFKKVSLTAASEYIDYITLMLQLRIGYRALRSKLCPLGGDREPHFCKNNISPSFFSPSAGARLSDHGVHLLSCSSALIRREYQKRGDFFFFFFFFYRGVDNEEPQSSHGCTGGRRGFAQ